MSPEMDTLDQLEGGNMSLQVVHRIFPDEEGFVRGVQGLLQNGDVRLRSQSVDVPQWQWRELLEGGKILNELFRFELELTEQGASRIR
jgi:hypothetical protein